MVIRFEGSVQMTFITVPNSSASWKAFFSLHQLMGDQFAKCTPAHTFYKPTRSISEVIG